MRAAVELQGESGTEQRVVGLLLLTGAAKARLKLVWRCWVVTREQQHQEGSRTRSKCRL